MTSKVVEAFGAHSRMTVAQALGSAEDAGLTECVVIGYDEDGDMVIRSSGMARKDALWLLEQAKLHTLEVECGGEG